MEGYVSRRIVNQMIKITEYMAKIVERERKLPMSVEFWNECTFFLVSMQLKYNKLVYRHNQKEKHKIDYMNYATFKPIEGAVS